MGASGPCWRLVWGFENHVEWSSAWRQLFALSPRTLAFRAGVVASLADSLIRFLLAVFVSRPWGAFYSIRIHWPGFGYEARRFVYFARQAGG